MTTSRRALWIAVLAGLAAFGALARHFAFTCDDAYITFRYAKNLAEGRGLIFNPGEHPPVEGYSNLLWALLLAAFHALGAKGAALASAANALSLGAAGAVLFLTARTAALRVGCGPLGTLATAVFLGTLAPFAVWATGGLETMAFTLALFGTYERLHLDPERPRGVQAAAWAAAAVLLRADGFGWVAAVLGLSALGWLRDRRPELRRALLVTAGTAAAVVAAHFLWRHSYYGEWMPNTARVKAGFSSLRLERGLAYLAVLLLTVPAFAALPAAAVALRGRPVPAVALPCLGVVLTALAYAIYVGGDFMPMGRFLVPAAPFLALLFAAAFRALEPRRLAVPLGAALVAAGVLLGTNALRWPQDLLQRYHFRWNSPEARSEYEQWAMQRYQADVWATIGRGLGRSTSPGESMIRGPVGAVGYFSELFLYDLNGLVTPEVARRDVPLTRRSPGHDKHVSFDYFFPRRPTYLAAVLVAPGAPETAGLGPDMLQNPGVQRMLQRGKIRLERHALPPDEGFPPGLELRLLRLIWD